MDDYIQGNLFMSEQNSQEELQPNTKKTLTLKKEALTNLKKEALDKLKKENLAKAAENFKEALFSLKFSFRYCKRRISSFTISDINIHESA